MKIKAIEGCKIMKNGFVKLSALISLNNVIKVHKFQPQGSAIEAVQDRHTANNRGVKLIC